MASPRLLSTSRIELGILPLLLGPSRAAPGGLGHLGGMEPIAQTETLDHDPLERVLSLSELASRLHVSVQTLYDLRSQGRGPRGFRIGRELRFRGEEVDAWLARLEEDDAARHPAGGPR